MRRAANVVVGSAVGALALIGCGTDGPLADRHPDHPVLVEDGPCAMLDVVDLRQVFGEATPPAHPRAAVDGWSECVWVDDGREVRISLQPASTARAARTGSTTSLAARPGRTGHPGVVGAEHTSSGGWTVAIRSDEGRALVGVRTAGAGDDDALASRFAEAVAAAWDASG